MKTSLTEIRTIVQKVVREELSRSAPERTLIQTLKKFVINRDDDVDVFDALKAVLRLSSRLSLEDAKELKFIVKAADNDNLGDDNIDDLKKILKKLK